MRRSSALSERAFSVLTAALEDERKLIAAGKVQRWEVLKWVLAVNLAVTAAAVVTAQRSHWLIPAAFLMLTIVIATAGHFLIGHYNRRLDSTRDASTILESRILSESFAGALTRSTIARPVDDSAESIYDKEETRIFNWVIRLSPLPAALVAMLAFLGLTYLAA